MEIPNTEIKQNITQPLPVPPPPHAPSQNKGTVIKIILSISCLVALLAIGFYFWSYQKNKSATPKLEGSLDKIWDKFLESNSPVPPKSSFIVSYNDRIGKNNPREASGPILEWNLELSGSTLTDTQNPKNHLVDLSYKLNSGDIGARLDTHMALVGPDVYFKTANNPLLKIALRDLDPNSKPWIKISGQNTSGTLEFSDSDIKQIKDAWSIKKILTPIGAEIDKTNPNLTHLIFTSNQDGINSAIDTTVTLYAIQQLKTGNPISQEDKNNITTVLKSLFKKININELSFWIDKEQHLTRVKGSLVVPSLIQTLEQVGSPIQNSFVSMVVSNFSSPRLSKLALQLTSPQGQVLGMDTFSTENKPTTISSQSSNPLDNIIYDALLNFDYNYSGINEVQVFSPPKDYFDITPYLNNLEEDITKQNLKI